MNKWKDAYKKKPNIGDTILVKTVSNQIFYAVYSADDEFDVHRPDSEDDYRNKWFKFSSRTVIFWRYFS